MIEFRSGSRWIVFGALSGAALAGGGCNCGKGNSSSLVTETGIPTTLKQLNFGNVAVGQTVRLPLPLSNTGTAPLDIATQKISGAEFTEPTAAPGALAPSGKGRAIVAFAPTQPGPASGALVLDDDGSPAQVSVALTGVGLDLDVSANPTTLNFGPVPVGILLSPTQTVALTNNGSAPVYVAVSATATAAQYTVLDPNDNRLTGAQVQVAPSGSYIVTVAFSPDSVSIFNSSFNVTICQDQTTKACLLPQLVTLTGQGIAGQLALTPNPIAFTGVPSGQSVSQTITVTNVGNASANVTCLYLASLGPSACGTASSVFALGAPSLGLPATLAAGGSFTLPLTYQPSGAPVDADALDATYIPQGLTSSSTATDPVQGGETVAPCSLALSPTSLNFTYQTTGTPVGESVTLTNSGDSTCQVTGIAIDPSSDPAYSLAAGQAPTLTLAASGGSAQIAVAFDLPSSGPPSTRIGRLDFQSNDPAHASVQVPLVASAQTPYAGNGAWPRWHHDNIQSGLSASDTSWLKGTIAWTVSVGAPGNNYFTAYQADYMNSPVVGSDGTVYQLGMDGTLYAVNSSGAIQWATLLEGPVVDPHPGTPIIAKDGTLYVAFGDTFQVGLDAGLYHVSGAGAVLSAIPPSGGGDGFDLPPMLTNGGLLLGSDDAAGAFAFTSDGTFDIVATNPNVTYEYDQTSAVVGPDDTTYWCAGAVCDALSPPASGFAELAGWPITPDGTFSATSDLALDEFFTGNLMLLLGGWEAGEGNVPQEVASINPATAQIVWAISLPPPTGAQQSALYAGLADATVGNSCPAIGTDGTVYIGNFDGLHALDGRSGREKTGFPFLTNDSDVLTAPAIGGDGTIFFGTADGTFYAIHPDGTLRFKVSAGCRVAGSPAIGPSGAVYFTANDGYLYAVQ